jgi:hypothetical protein
VIGEVLEVGGSEAQRARTIEETFDRASDFELKEYILSHCSHEYLQSKLPQFVSRGLWMQVDLVLKRGVSGKLLKWAVKEASKRVEEQDFINHIWPHCSGIDSVMTHLVRRRLWRSVRLVLEKGVHEKQAMCVLYNACTCCPDTRLLYAVGKKGMVVADTSYELGKKGQVLDKSTPNTLLPDDQTQCEALSLAMQQNRWDVITQACLLHV